MNTRLRCVLLAAAVWCVAAVPANAKRVGLVIGNTDYLQVTKLEKAGNDAEAMARELAAAGFEVTKYQNLGYRNTVRAFEAFYDRIAGGDEVAIFYAGHGVQTRTGSYLLPIDIEGDTESQVEKISYSVNDVLGELERAKPRYSLIIVDACRDNPLRSRGRTIGAAKGLTAPDVARGQMVIFSAGRGQQALDSLGERDPNPNGVFTREFVARMRQPGVSVEAIALQVRTSVEQLAAAVGHSQRPYVINEASGNFYFYGHGPESQPVSAGVAVGQTAASTPPSPIALAAQPSVQSPLKPFVDPVREDMFWGEAKLPDNVEGYEAYLAAYPDGRYVGLARAHIARLNSQSGRQFQTQPTVPTPPPEAPKAPVKPTTEQSNGHPPPVVSDARASATPPAETSDTRKGIPAKVRVVMSNGDIYEGESIGGIRQGQGSYLFSNGNRYEGSFVDNWFHGNGTIYFVSGDRYEGPFVRNIREGVGAYIYVNGDRYEGEFVNDMFNGKGRLILVNGDRYVGEFKGDKKDGHGTHFFADGGRYEGEFRGGVQSGHGTYFFTNGDRYEGEFRNGIRNGNGVYYSADGRANSLVFVNGEEKNN